MMIQKTYMIVRIRIEVVACQYVFDLIINKKKYEKLYGRVNNEKNKD